jgi:general secretion pathway protein D
VKLFIRQEVSSIAGPISTNSTELVTDKREIETTVLVDNGEVIVLGGLIQNDERISVDKVPFLGDIPVLGKIFQSKSKSRQRTNLMVFLRPTIVRSVDDMREVSGRKYNYMRAEQLLQNQGKGTDLNTFMNEVMGATPQGAEEAGE